MKILTDSEARQINILDERFYQNPNNPECYYPSVTAILDAYYKGYGFNDWLKSNGYNADIILERAAKRGSTVHGMIEAYIDGFLVSWLNDDLKPKYALDEWQMFCKFIDFWETYNPEVVISEMKIVSESLRFGGAIDLICKLNGELWLIDFKTSNNLHKVNELQLSAYAMAWNEINPTYPIQNTGILWLNSATRGADKTGKKIQGAGWQLKTFDRPYQEAFRLFQHTQAIWEEENPNYKPKNLIYKMEFQRDFNKEKNELQNPN